AHDLQQHAEHHPAVLTAMRLVTNLGGIPAMVVLTSAGSLAALLRRRRLLATVWLFAAVGGGLFILLSKQYYDRPRPANPDRAVTEENESFPSGHSMGSLVGYGMLGYAGCLGLRKRWWRVALLLGLTAVVALIGFSRLYLRAHYF